MITREPTAAGGYPGAFHRVTPLLPGRRLAWLQQARQAAIDRFADLGFPTRRDEDWKYTNISPIADGRFNVLPSPSSTHLAGLVKAHALPGTHLLVFVNGQVEPAFCRIGQLPSGTVLRSLAYALDHHPAPVIEAALRVPRAPTAFDDLNLAFMADGAYLALPPDTRLEKPVQLLFIAAEGTPAIQPRNIIDIGARSAVCLIEQHVSEPGNAYFTNTVTDIAVGAGADVSHYKVEQEDRQAFHVANIRVTQDADSHFLSASFALGGRLARIGIDLHLAAEGASCELTGLYIADGHQHIDHHTRIEHCQPRCTSRELYKGILDDAAHGVFNGRIVVHPAARQTDAAQANHNLLLSPNAEIDAQPRLEIRADDVQCRHGATVGSLDDDQIFYLRTRGLDLAEARSMLTLAFAREVIERIHWLPLRERLDTLVQSRLARLERSSKTAPAGKGND